LQINLQLAIATVASIVFNEPIVTNRPRVQNRRQRSRKNQINNKRILISNSQNIEISNDDIDLISNIEVLFQVLETLLKQLDIV